MINYTPEDLADHHAVAAVIKDKKSRVLVQEHVKFGFWTIPVGKAKKEQSPEEGIKEEVFEECNLNILELKEIDYKEIEYERNGRNIRVFTHIFEVINYSGNIKNKEPHKHKQQKFMPIEEIKKLPYLSDATLMFLKTLGIKRGARVWFLWAKK